MFARLRDSLSKSRRALTQELASAAFDPGDELAWERLEEALIRADVGVRATAELVRRLEARGEIADLNAALAEEIAVLFGEPPMLGVAGRPSVLLVVGVNGTGKTTTIGKLAEQLRRHGRSVVRAAADTFRAAAEEQLEIWADRAGAEFVGAERGADPASVAYEAIETAARDRRDVVIVDTAGGGGGRSPAYAGEPDGGAREDPARDRREAGRRAARDVARCGRDDGAERARAGPSVW
jgi:fused signal recognition particle receptor